MKSKSPHEKALKAIHAKKNKKEVDPYAAGHRSLRKLSQGIKMGPSRS